MTLIGYWRNLMEDLINEQILENIFENNYTTKIKNFQIQFHPEPPGAEEAYERLTKVLSKTHNLDWHYQWVWENWSLK